MTISGQSQFNKGDWFYSDVTIRITQNVFLKQLISFV